MSELLALWGPRVGAGIMLLALCVMFRGLLRRVLKLAVRSGAGLGVLAAARPVLAPLGIALGLNLTNALVLGVLGAPGFGLLLLLRWAALR